jgi:UTP--glucose-1-phosphate uridylyltransferase
MRKYGLPTKAIITDAGFASRFLPITKTIPKGMLPIGNKPIMQLVIEECIDAGIKEIIIVTTAEGQPIYKDYFENAVIPVKKQLESQHKGDRYEEVKKILNFPKIIVITQDPALPYGTASPIISARPYLSDDEAFLALQSDDVVFGASDAKTLIETYAAHEDANGVIMAQEVAPEEVSKYGIVVEKDGSKLDHIVEKPKVDEAPTRLATYGRYLHTPKIFDYFDELSLAPDGELWQVDAITKMASEGVVYVEKTRGHWMTTGDPRNYFLTSLRYTLDNEEFADEARAMLK